MKKFSLLPNKGPAIIFVHVITWLIYATLIYLANYMTDPSVKILRTFLFLLPFVATFYISIRLLNAFQNIETAWVVSVFCIFFVLMAVIGHLYIYVVLPMIGIELYKSSQLDDFIKGAVLGFLQYFGYALLYHYVERNIKRKLEVRRLTEQALKNQLETARLKEADLRAAQENLLLEQAFLRAEINPHFLHNTLNVLYAQAQGYSETLASNIAKLSRMMRYSIETTEEQPGRVPIEKEIENLELLLDIHRMRFHETRPVTLRVEGKPAGQTVPPLSMITMVENAMKYGDLTDPRHPVTISLRLRENELHFNCRNKIRRRPSLFGSTNRGLANLKRRLDVNFKDQYILINQRDEAFWNVELIIYN